MAFVALSFPLFSAATDSRTVDLKQIQGALNRSKANWSAKATWLSELPASELEKVMGLQHAPEGDLDFEAVPGFRNNELPVSIDWRNKDGVNWIGPIMNQGNCGSCVAFAAVATLEAQASISAGLPWLRSSFSPQALFSCGGGGCGIGWLSGEAAAFLSSRGVPDEACMPYTSGSTSEDVACSNLCADASARTYKIASYTMPSHFGTGREVVKEALKNGPLVTSMRVYADFVTYAGGIYKHVSGPSLGGHAISLIGYDENKRAWLIRNSWGMEWGEAGFGWISWDDRSGVGVDTYKYNPMPEKTHISVNAPLDREYISGEYLLLARAQGLATDLLQFRIKSPQGKDFGAYSCTLQKDTCSTQLDTRQLPEGRYEVFAETATSGIKSQPRSFYVINSKPRLSLSFQAASGVDLSKPLKGRPEFLIQAVSSPVPIQHLEFVVLDLNEKPVVIKTNEYVLESIKMGWRTLGVPNGAYKIYFRGETNYNGKTYSVETPRASVTVQN